MTPSFNSVDSRNPQPDKAVYQAVETAGSKARPRPFPCGSCLGDVGE